MPSLVLAEARTRRDTATSDPLVRRTLASDTAATSEILIRIRTHRMVVLPLKIGPAPRHGPRSRRWRRRSPPQLNHGEHLEERSVYPGLRAVVDRERGGGGARCKERRQLMKSVVCSHNAFATAHSAYIVSLKDIGSALSEFAQGESYPLPSPPPLPTPPSQASLRRFPPSPSLQWPRYARLLTTSSELRSLRWPLSLNKPNLLPLNRTARRGRKN